MNILDTVAISLPCRSCGNNYQVPLKDVLLSHTMLHQGCPVSQETECPPVFQSRLFECKDIEELQRAWNQLEQRAQADGGELVLMAAGPSAEAQPSVHNQAIGGTATGAGICSGNRNVSESAGERRKAIRKTPKDKNSKAGTLKDEDTKKQEDCLSGKGSTLRKEKDHEHRREIHAVTP